MISLNFHFLYKNTLIFLFFEVKTFMCVGLEVGCWKFQEFSYQVKESLAVNHECFESQKMVRHLVNVREHVNEGGYTKSSNFLPSPSSPRHMNRGEG